MKERKIGCLVMAAGNAERFGENKLAAVYRGKMLIEHALDAVPRELFSQVVVVTQYPQIEALAVRCGFTPVRNEEPRRGLSHTIRLGTQKLCDCDAVLYMVSDQPLLDADSVRCVIERWKEQPDAIVGAAHNGRRGNPCIFPKEFFPNLMELTGDCGGNVIIRAHPERLVTVEIPQKELSDVDTPEALQALRRES